MSRDFERSLRLAKQARRKADKKKSRMRSDMIKKALSILAAIVLTAFAAWLAIQLWQHRGVFGP